MTSGAAPSPISYGGSAFLAPERCLVRAVHRHTHDTVTINLEPESNAEISWQPGQFNMLYLFGLGEVPISISGDFEERRRLGHTIRNVGPVTKALTELQCGSPVWLRGPYGSSWPNIPGDVDALLIAGGIGLAPLRPVLQKRISEQATGRTTLLYGTRSPHEVLFAQELLAWSHDSRRQAPDILISVDRGDAAWHGAVGVVTNLLRGLDLQPKRTIALTCGPEVMMRHVASDLASLGLEDSQIYVSLERNMKCATGFCGRCQWGPHFVCRDGPIYRLSDIKRFWHIKEF